MDSEAINTWLENEKMGENGCFNDDPDSLIPSFEKEVNDLGFRFETSDQGFKYIPRNKRIIGPIALKYYNLAKETGKANEQNYFMKFFCIRGYDEVVPMLLMDYRSDKTNDLTRWFISDCIYEIRSQIFLEDY